MRGKRKTIEEFINEAQELHGNNYRYSQVVYKNNRTKVEIICPVHGVFEQTPSHHLICGNGCPKCADGRKGQYKKLTREDFITRSNKVHKYKYEYSFVEYINSQTDVEIICPEHGIFTQTPSNHMIGKGCIQCGRKRTTKSAKENPTGWSYSSWGRNAEKSKNFHSFKVYFLECWDEETGERFYKIGRTFKTIKDRFRSTLLPYSYNVIYTIELEDARRMCQLEQEYKSLHKNHKHTPIKDFKGMNECYSKIVKV